MDKKLVILKIILMELFNLNCFLFSKLINNLLFEFLALNIHKYDHFIELIPGPRRQGHRGYTQPPGWARVTAESDKQGLVGLHSCLRRGLVGLHTNLPQGRRMWVLPVLHKCLGV